MQIKGAYTLPCIRKEHKQIAATRKRPELNTCLPICARDRNRRCPSPSLHVQRIENPAEVIQKEQFIVLYVNMPRIHLRIRGIIALQDDGFSRFFKKGTHRTVVPKIGICPSDCSFHIRTGIEDPPCRLPVFVLDLTICFIYAAFTHGFQGGPQERMRTPPQGNIRLCLKKNEDFLCFLAKVFGVFKDWRKGCAKQHNLLPSHNALPFFRQRTIFSACSKYRIDLRRAQRKDFALVDPRLSRISCILCPHTLVLHNNIVCILHTGRYRKDFSNRRARYKIRHVY